MRVLLLMLIVFASIFARAQAVFEIETPSSIKGFYKFGLGDSTIDYRWGNGNTSKKSIGASLALGKDSLAREALELNVKGKIAVLYRGAAAFTDIALRAQDAGALAVIIVNNRPATDPAQGGTFNIALPPGTTQLSIKIPVIIISQEDGQLITNQIRTGADVKGYIGKKRLLNFDVKVSDAWISTPLYRTRPVFLAKKGMISDSLGLSVINAGKSFVKNLFVISDISFGGNSIHADTILIDSLAANGDVNNGDTLYFKFRKPFSPKFDLSTGVYTLKYYLRQLKIENKDTSIVVLNDDFKDDNEALAYFTISDSTLAIGNTISYTSAANNNTVYTNKGNWSTATNTGANLKDFKSCLVYKNIHSNKINITSMDFLAYAFDANATLANSKVGIDVYKWKPLAGKILDPNYTLKIDELTPEVESAEYQFKNAYKSDYGTYNFKNDGITLDSSAMYLFCVSTTTPSIGFGFNTKNEPQFWPAMLFNNQYLMPVFSNGTFYKTGFGSDKIPAITLNFKEKATLSSSKDIISYKILSPAVTAKVGIDKITLTVPNVTIIDSLIASFKLSPKATMIIDGIKQVSDSSKNNFSKILTAIVKAEDGSTKTYEIILSKAPKSSDKIIVSCKQGASFGFIDNDKVIFNLPTGTDLTNLVFTYTVSPLAKAFIFDSLGKDKDSIFTSDVTKVNTSGLVKIKVIAEDGSVKYYDLIVKIVKSTSKLLTSFKFLKPAATGVLDNGIYNISVPKGTDVKGLVATFVSSAKSKVFIGDSLQVSGVTPNNFTDTVRYKVVAEDGSEAIYLIVVNVLKSEGNLITKFGFVDPAVTGVISGSNITVKVPKATDFSSLVATFEASIDAIVKVGGKVQVSGTTSNDFTKPVTYTVISEAGVSKEYNVLVEEDNKSNACVITSFKLKDSTATYNGVISGTNISVKVAKSVDIKKLVAIFTASTNSTVKIDTVKQVSGQTINDFTKSVSYIVVAEDGVTSKTYTVTVSFETNLSLSNLTTNNIVISPNPSNGLFTIKANSGSLSINVTDVAGKLVYQFNDITMGNHIIELNGMEAGVYVATITNNGVTETHKLQITE